MKIYRYKEKLNDYECFDYVNSEDKEFFLFDYKGQSLKNKWDALPVKTSGNGMKSDFPYTMVNSTVFSERAVKVLGDFLENTAEIIPVDHPKGKYYLVNVVNVLKAIDANKSEIIYREDGKFSRYKRLAFHEDLVAEQHIFKVYYHNKHLIKNTALFVSENFRDCVLNNELVGLDFFEEWDSERAYEDEKKAFEKMVTFINGSLDKNYSFEEALQQVLKKGKTAISDKWAIRRMSDKDAELGELQLDGTYLWMKPAFIPPILLSYQWGIKEEIQA
ncbi:imm11 family protein [Bacillus alkalicellulosilyticus]|uniref:imm11 family protein n=1 Tax=Alkalihalobacterium alkalicellulosilyticum TaxID=1912214 RepID=UPI00099832A9|nr:DUF1629 domain-containing protein [Bacillus alkalicellulosilyticus]